MADLDARENRRNLTLPESNFWQILKKPILRPLHYQKLYWKKPCTIRWVQLGDEDPKFLKATASKRFHKNNITTLQLENGTLVDNHAGKEALISKPSKIY